MKNLTCNQLILLLQIYRGISELTQEDKIGTHKIDLDKLRGMNLIVSLSGHNHLFPEVTEQGHEYVRVLLANKIGIRGDNLRINQTFNLNYS